MPLSGNTTTIEVPGTLVWRIGAHVIDAFLLMALFVTIWAVAENFVSLSYVPYINTTIVLGYAIGMESAQGRTLGKRLLRLRVRNADGDLPTLGQAFRRNLYFVLALLPGFIGGLIALAVVLWISAAILVDIDHRQGIHDRFARETFVTRSRRA